MTGNSEASEPQISPDSALTTNVSINRQRFDDDLSDRGGYGTDNHYLSENTEKL